MTEPSFEVPKIAEIPPPARADAIAEPVDEELDVATRAALMIERFKKERQQFQILLTEATLSIEARNRQIEAYKVDLAEARNNFSVLQSQCEGLRQEVADCRAFFSSIRAQLEHFEIPLPVRRKVKNGKQIAA